MSLDEGLFSKLDVLAQEANVIGADGFDVICSQGKSFSLTARDGKIDSQKASSGQSFGIRVIKNQKVGISYTELADTDALKACVRKAFDTLNYVDPKEYEKILSSKAERLIHDDAKSGAEPIEKKTDLVLDLEKKVFDKDARVQGCPYNGYGESVSSSYYLDSNGLQTYESSNYYSCYTSAHMKDGDQQTMYYQSSVAKDFSGLDVDYCVNESVEHAKNWLKASPLKSGEYDVLFSTDLLSSLFEAFAGVFSAKTALDKNNPLFEKYQKTIASSSLSLMDDPHFDLALGKYVFDSEGSRVAPLKLIDAGKFSGLLHNSATAEYFNMPNTSRASRSSKGPLGVSSTNWVISTGSDKREQLFSGQYFEIVDMQGLHSGLNFMSGDFSFGASGYLCDGGKRVSPVKGVTVASNFYKLIKQIKGLTNELNASGSKSFFAPEILFEGLSVAGV